MRPRVQDDVRIDYPEGESAELAGKVSLEIFIDADGGVDEVLATAAQLPDAFVATARQAFLHARFSPGEIDGRRVPARVRIEVNFGDDVE